MLTAYKSSWNTVLDPVLQWIRIRSDRFNFSGSRSASRKQKTARKFHASDPLKWNRSSTPMFSIYHDQGSTLFWQCWGSVSFWPGSDQRIRCVEKLSKNYILVILVVIYVNFPRFNATFPDPDPPFVKQIRVQIRPYDTDPDPQTWIVLNHSWSRIYCKSIQRIFLWKLRFARFTTFWTFSRFLESLKDEFLPINHFCLILLFLHLHTFNQFFTFTSHLYSYIKLNFLEL